jgi:hypothetical protein
MLEGHRHRYDVMLCDEAQNPKKTCGQMSVVPRRRAAGEKIGSDIAAPLS